MKASVFSEIKQSITTPKCLFGVIGVVIVLFFASIDAILDVFHQGQLLPRGWHSMQLINAVKSDTFLSVMPILSAIPYTARFYDELKSGFVKYYLHRTSVNKYLVSKVASCFVSGGTVLVSGILVTWVILALSCTPMESREMQHSVIVLVLLTCVRVFISGGLWSVVGLLLSATVGSKYIAYASPFIVYYLLVILQERYMQNVFALSPKQWMCSAEIYPAVILSAELAVICATLFWVAGKRRLARL